MTKRIIEDDIERYLENKKILLLLGARQVGKTTIIKNIMSKLTNRNSYMSLENPLLLQSLNEHPENIFKVIGKSGEKITVFIDEIQYLENPSNFLKYIYDEYNETIKLVVTGSSAFYIDKKFKDSLAGRKKIFYINSLNFEEFLIFKKKEKLIQYLKSENIILLEKNNILNYYHEYITYGGYPDVVLENNIEEKKSLLEEIGLSYIKKDIFEAGVEYEEKYFFILKILASQVGNLLNINEIANTVNLNTVTVERYIYIMRKSFHIATIKPFFEKNIRKELTKMPKIYFYDLGLRNYFVNNFENIEYRIDKGELFENVIFRKLLNTYKLDDIKFWRTQNKNEVDFVMEGDRKAIEVKFDKNKFNPKKYKLFTQTYSEYNLECIDFEESLKLLH